MSHDHSAFGVYICQPINLSRFRQKHARLGVIMVVVIRSTKWAIWPRCLLPCGRSMYVPSIFRHQRRPFGT